MNATILDTSMRVAAFDHIRRLNEIHDHLTATELQPGFLFRGERIPLVNPQRGIFKPQQMRFLLSIKTVFPKPGGKVWYDDQRDVQRQIFHGDEAVDYAFMGKDPDAADNRWLKEAYENQIPVIYFLGAAPGRYQAILPTFISGWDGQALKARITFGPNPETLAPPLRQRGATICASHGQAATASGYFQRGGNSGLRWTLCVFRPTRVPTARRSAHHCR
jgi:putative restriction endonuclease